MAHMETITMERSLVRIIKLHPDLFLEKSKKLTRRSRENLESTYDTDSVTFVCPCLSLEKIRQTSGAQQLLIRRLSSDFLICVCLCILYMDVLFSYSFFNSGGKFSVKC